jgi:hypothetical protein
MAVTVSHRPYKGRASLGAMRAGVAAAFACNLPLKPTASVAGRDYAAPGIGADPLYDAWLVMCPGCRGLFRAVRHGGAWCATLRCPVPACMDAVWRDGRNT